MSDDLVERLRYLSRVFRRDDVEDLTRDDYLSAQLYPDEAADRIEQLTAELTTARADYQIERDLREVEEALLKAAEADAARLRALLAEADRRIVWEALGFGSDFASRVEAALKGDSHE